MVAVSFGSYATSLFAGDDAWSGWDNVFTSLLVVGMAVINMVGAQFVSKVASMLVILLLGVFAFFIAVTITDIDLDMLAFSTYPSFSDIVASIALTVGSLANPRIELPRAMVLALGLTTVTYVLISISVFGTLTVDETIQYGETAIAEAARPALGDAGFTIMAVAALLATAGATNATLFGSSNLTKMLAQLGQFPPIFGKGSRLGPNGGLIITASIVFVVANVVNLSAIASVGSACALVVFLMVGIAGYRRRAETGANGPMVLAGVGATALVLAFFAVDTLQNAPETFTAIIGIGLLAVVLDVIWKRVRGTTPSDEPEASPVTPTA
jgi:amino acid transporter